MTFARLFAACLALGVFATIATRIWLRMEGYGESFGQAIWAMYRFYTIWTNTLIGVACAAFALGRQVTPQMFSNLLLSIIIVAGVYHALLAHLNDFTGLDEVVDQMLHTIIPVGFLVFWLIHVPKAPLRFAHIVAWLGLPLIYCLYAMARAQLDGVYPYFFLDLGKLGVVQTAINIFGLLVAFAGLGALIVWGGQRLARVPAFAGIKP